MINPSATGWIDKFFTEQKLLEETKFIDSSTFYDDVRDTGFIYGHIISFQTSKAISTKGWFKEEISKVALLNTLHGIYCIDHVSVNSANFIAKLLAFYDEMNPKGLNLFTKILPKNSSSSTLEKIIDQRVQTNNSVIGKNFSHLVTNALLFIDILAFQQYLIHNAIPEKYLKKIEETIINVVALALKVKSKKSQYDDLLIKLFEASIRYSKFSKISVQNLEALQLDYLSTDLEKKYLIDLACMALWSDAEIENEELYFLYSVAAIVGLPAVVVDKSISKTFEFITNHKNEIPYFNYSNPVKHFYDQTTQSVIALITRNKNRLIKELGQSKELMLLLSYSTIRDLNEKEKKKVKKQLLEICKTVPSLAIFLLPGGSLLLPILIKFIPQLLPSAFNENKEEEPTSN